MKGLTDVEQFCMELGNDLHMHKKNVATDNLKEVVQLKGLRIHADRFEDELVRLVEDSGFLGEVFRGYDRLIEEQEKLIRGALAELEKKCDRLTPFLESIIGVSVAEASAEHFAALSSAKRREALQVAVTLLRFQREILHISNFYERQAHFTAGFGLSQTQKWDVFAQKLAAKVDDTYLRSQNAEDVNAQLKNANVQVQRMEQKMAIALDMLANLSQKISELPTFKTSKEQKVSASLSPSAQSRRWIEILSKKLERIQQTSHQDQDPAASATSADDVKKLRRQIAELSEKVSDQETEFNSLLDSYNCAMKERDTAVESMERLTNKMSKLRVDKTDGKTKKRNK